MVSSHPPRSPLLFHVCKQVYWLSLRTLDVRLNVWSVLIFSGHHPSSTKCSQGYPQRYLVIPFTYSLLFTQRSYPPLSHPNKSPRITVFLSQGVKCSHSGYSIGTPHWHKEVNWIPTGLLSRLSPSRHILPPTLHLESQTGIPHCTCSCVVN